MSALSLALLAKRNGASFSYRGGRVVIDRLDALPKDLRAQVEARLADVVACVAEQSAPCELLGSDIVDAARDIVQCHRSATTRA